MPALHGGRIEGLLPHVRRPHDGLIDQVQGDHVGQVRVACQIEVAGQTAYSHDHLHRAFDLREPRLLEEVGQQQGAHHRPDVVAGLEVDAGQGLNSILVGLVRHEEVVQLRGDEPGGGGLTNDDVNDVLAVEPAPLAQEFLLPVVVVLGYVLERWKY